MKSAGPLHNKYDESDVLTLSFSHYHYLIVVALPQDIKIYFLRSTSPHLVSVLIYDSYGTIVRRISNVMAIEGDQLSVSIGNLAAGIYYVQAISANGKAQGKMKFIKMN